MTDPSSPGSGSSSDDIAMTAIPNTHNSDTWYFSLADLANNSEDPCVLGIKRVIDSFSPQHQAAFKKALAQYNVRTLGTAFSGSDGPVHYWQVGLCA